MKSVSENVEKENLLNLYHESLDKIETLERNLEHLTGVMIVLKEDLQIKDEQFEFLYSSIRAQTEQTAQSRDCEEQNLRSRVELLEGLLLQRDAEKEQLMIRLSEANRKLILLSNTKSSTCWFNSIPDEILRKSLMYLDDKSLSMISCVNKHIYSCASADNLWITRFRARWGKSRQFRVRKDGNRCWRTLYGSCHFIDDNWQKQRARVFECKAHSGTVTCLALCGDRMVSGSDDGSMASWELGETGLYGSPYRQGRSAKERERDSSYMSAHLLPPPSLPLAQLVEQEPSWWGGGAWRMRRSGGAGAELGTGSTSRQQGCSKLRTFHGHGGPVWCLDYDPVSEQLVSGSYDRTLKVWDTCSGSCVHTLRGHTGWVSSLMLLKGQDKAVSSSWDCTVRMWSLEDGELLHTLSSGPGNALYCVGASADGRTVGAGCRQAQVQRWDTETGIPREPLLGHSKEVHCLQLCDRVVLSGSGDASVKVWEASSGKCVTTIRDHTATVMTLQFDNDFRLVTGSYDKTVKVWDMRNTQAALTTIAAHQAAVFCIKFDDYRLVTGGADHSLKVFDFASQPFV
eukprot:CAMPEP_0182419568 /NCGR_PEP_ID=MMETSP1167-20130531/3994_1 /TAXON_ID=2988 /ORGANISM="Mallomonas Sp, Strain CCMP3275" /LENGTH=570 /DNA_ID=CAMNT_0024594561 /DNA_START=104 /DNA_END=1816 /DNA_ORIENTATION=+